MSTVRTAEPGPRAVASAESEADLLALELRNSRLTVVCGAPGSVGTPVPASGLLTQLQRRAGDHQLGGAPWRDARRPVRERRYRAGSGSRTAELVVLVDTWTEHPLATLQRRIHDSLARAGVGVCSSSLPIAKSLAAWSRLLDVRFLIVLDRFDDFLAAAAATDEGRRFTGECRLILRQRRLAANLLLSVRSGAELAVLRYQAQLLGRRDEARVREDGRLRAMASPSVREAA